MTKLPIHEFGVPCPQCKRTDRQVIETRGVKRTQTIRRRCLCTNCGYRYSTYEFLKDHPVTVTANTIVECATVLDTIKDVEVQMQRLSTRLTTLRSKIESVLSPITDF